MNSIIQTPTPNLKRSLDFYKRLNFEVLSEKNPTIVSDGKAVIEINPERAARTGVKLYKNDWQRTIAEIRGEYPVLKIDSGYLVGDPSGVWIYLLEGQEPEINISGIESSTLGNFAGLGIESLDIEKSQELWQILGFVVKSGDADQGWVTLDNSELGISFMKPLACPHLFFNPSLTYFNGERNMQIIEEVRKLEVPIVEEITHFNNEGIVDNVIIRDPGGLGAFLFND